MKKKYCPNCDKYSYSAKEEGSWICPTCGVNLTSQPIEPLDKNDCQSV